MGTEMTKSDSLTLLNIQPSDKLNPLRNDTHAVQFNTVMSEEPWAIRRCLYCCSLCSGEAGGAGYGLPGVWWADDRHPGNASLLFPLGPTSGRVAPQLSVSIWGGGRGGGASRYQGVRILLHHHSAEGLPDGTVFLHDVCGRENIQTGDFSYFVGQQLCFLLLFISLSFMGP